MDYEAETAASELKNYYKKFISGMYDEGCIHSKSPSDTLLDFLSNFQVVDAAGGLVKDEKDRLLMIFRNKKWDLPKGHLEKGETIEYAAQREVVEETGIKNVSMGAPLGCTYHMYEERKKWFVKRTYWFEMSCHSAVSLIPQTEEGITQIEWVDRETLKSILPKTHDSLVDMIRDEYINRN